MQIDQKKFFQVIRVISLLAITLSISSSGRSQERPDPVRYTPYELLSTYYSENFNPFSKRNVFVGLSFSLEDRRLTNTDNLIQRVIEGERKNYNITLKGGYYTGNYGMAGISFNYYQNKFQGDIFRDPDTLQSNTITRGFAFTPYFRSSVPLTDNERLSFFTELDLTFGRSNSLDRTTKNVDEIEQIYGTNYNFRIGLSPGITFFVMEAFAIEFQLNVLGYELTVEKVTGNGVDDSKEVRQNVDFDIDILSLKLGLAYYFGAKKQ